jgi:hypothetical protein
MFDIGLEIGYPDGLVRGYVTEVKTPKREPKTTISSAEFDSWKSTFITSYVIYSVVLTHKFRLIFIVLEIWKFCM